VQFKKYVHSGDRQGLSFDFPRAPWSEPYYRALQSRLEQDGIEFVIQPTQDQPVTEFLQVDCAGGLGRCSSAPVIVMFDVFHLPRDSRVRILLEQRP
jgi:hypothetical protein